MIPFASLARKYRQFRKPVHQAVARVFRRGWFILGPEVRAFEAAFARYLGVRHVIGVNSGTDAIFLSLKALNVGPGDEVITVANTATPTVSAIRMTGATPVFVDVLADRHTLDPSLLDAAVTRRTRAIVPVHLYGFPAGLHELLGFARRHKLAVVEDACQAHGARYAGHRVGTFGKAGCFSFYPTKNLGALGDAGAIATNDRPLAERLRAMRNYGEVAKFRNALEGVNTRLDELQAAVLTWGLTRLDLWNAQRERMAQVYLKKLQGLPLELPAGSDPVFQRVWHLFVIQLDQRDELRAYLAQRGVETMIHYPLPIHRQRAYRFLGYQSGDLPVTCRLARRILSLPLYPELKAREISAICAAIREFFASAAS